MNNPKAGLRMGFSRRDINRRTAFPLPLSLRGRQAVAISWYCVKICTMYQEIATGFALAMTVRGRPVPPRPGAAIFRVPSAERHGGRSLQEEAISMKRRGAAASRPPYGDGRTKSLSS